MRFGGHETFFLRPGWIAKGLELVEARTEADQDVTWGDVSAADAMGVGRNMSKSIGWWLGRCGLAERVARKVPIRLTPLGRAVLRHDPHLARLQTLWMLHFQLTLAGPEDVFSWFFGRRDVARLGREAIEGMLHADLAAGGQPAPAPRTLSRDVAVLLQSYARPIPPGSVDPEDNLDCPLRRLDLLVHRTDLHLYERRPSLAAVPPEALAAAICFLAPKGTRAELPLDHAGPLRQLALVLGRDLESAARLLLDAAAKAPALLTVDLSAGVQVIGTSRREPAAIITEEMKAVA